MLFKCYMDGAGRMRSGADCCTIKSSEKTEMASELATLGTETFAPTAPPLLRAITAALVFALVVVPLQPFGDLSRDAALSAWEAGDWVNQVVYTALCALTLLMIPIA